MADVISIRELLRAEPAAMDALTREPEAAAAGEGRAISWPEPLAEEAYHGLAGDIVRAVEPHTEADPAALLFSFLTLYGNVIGRSAHAVAEADRHFQNLFVCLVGITAKGRKGVSFGHIKKLFESVDPGWTRSRITQGLSSGEGLIWAVRDPIFGSQQDKKTKEITQVLLDAGVDDKRLICSEQEFASTLRVLRREGNTLSAVVRRAWDDGVLSTLTKNSPAMATDAHISILSHITKDELLRYLEDTEAANGFGNRFLWICVRRSKCLPEGGRLCDVDFASLIRELNEAVEYGKMYRELRRDQAAKELWAEVYPDLTTGRPGLLGSMTARAEAQVLRLSCIYALLDLSSTVRLAHLKAALACWQFAEDSARFIFGGTLGDPLADEILRQLKTSGQQGATRTEIYNHFGRHQKAEAIVRALEKLSERGMIACRSEPSAGRSAERWFLLKQ